MYVPFLRIRHCNLRPLRRVVLYCNVGWCVKGSAVHHRRQQCLIAKWLGLELGLGSGNGIFRSFFYFLC